MIDIEASRKICQAATEGPWCNRWNEVATDPPETRYDQRVVVAYPLSGEDVTVIGLLYYDGDNVAVKEPDAAFIAHARTALPEALDEIERLRIKLAGAEMRINLLRDTLKAIGQ